MNCKQASVKFWETPELIEKLLPYLDLKSTVRLAQTHEMTQNILQRRCIWNKLVRRSCPFIERGNPFGPLYQLGRVSERTVCDPFFKHATVGYVVTWLRPVTK